MTNSDAKDAMPSMEEFLSMVNASQSLTDNKIFLNVQRLIKNLDPIQSASVFCGLATIGSLQSNHIRISNLVHASLKFGIGKKQINKNQIRRLFRLLEGSSIDQAEDPAEDVFIATACTKRGSYKIFEGNWEGSTFFLERFIDIVDSMPDNGHFRATKQSVYALLMLSDVIAFRSRVEVNMVTAHLPETDIPQSALLPPDVLRQRVRFTEKELNEYGFDIQDLSPFIFNMSMASDLPFPSHHSLTNLDKCPVIDAGNGNYYLFAQGVSTAIRSYIISAYTGTQKGRDALTINLIRSYGMMLQGYKILGTIPPPPVSLFKPVQCGDVIIQEFLIEISKKRPLHLLFIFDGFYGQNLDNWAIADPVIIQGEEIALSNRIDNAKQRVAERSAIKHGITLLVTAGWGRPIGLEFNIHDTDDWSILHIGAHDLCHLSDHPEMKPLHLWRIINAEKWLETLNCKIFNINGMLNLFGWLIHNEWHIVPHELMPKEDLSPTGTIINIPTNHIADIRMTARKSKDRRMVQDIIGVPRAVIRYTGKSYFLEDEFVTLYGCIETIMQGKLAAVYVGEVSLWWCRVKNPNLDETYYRIWDSALYWLRRIDQAVYALGLNIPSIIEWHLDIVVLEKEINPDNQFSSCLQNQGIVLTTIRICPDGLFNKSDNSGEVAMVRSFLGKVLSNCGDGVVDKLIDIIFPNKEAKQLHIFRARIDDEYSANLPKPILIAKSDDANLRLGLGWLDGTSGRFLKIDGVDECVRHLNRVVDKVWNEIAHELRSYGKARICEKLILNIEATRREETNWKRTIRACLALHGDKRNVLDVANHEVGRFTAANLGSRLLVEMAVCTCPEDIESEPDELEVSTLLGYALLLYYLGAWSDAITYELLPPSIQISCFGQIMMDFEFEKSVMEPYHSMLGRQQREQEARRYDKLYDYQDDQRAAEEIFPHDFLLAWERDFHVSVDNVLKILNTLDDLGISYNKAVYSVHKSELIETLIKSIDGVNDRSVSMFLSRVSLPARSRWDQSKHYLSNDMEPKDWYPWNFRRKLSLVSRPIVELDNGDDPLLMVSPGFIREGVVYLLHNSFNATFDERHFHSDEMKKWVGDCRNRLGKEFNNRVAQKMIELGWEAESDIPVTKILKLKTQMDYGDIDVLAWSREFGVVLAIECKDLFLAKTHREIGNQINEFKGSVDDTGKRDRLRKHFDRLKVLGSYVSAVGRYVGLDDLSQIHGLVVFNRRNALEYAPQIPRDRIYVCAFEMLAGPAELVSKLIPWRS